MKHKNDISFKHNGKEHFLFQMMNFGKSTDELKFNFSDPKSNTSVIHNRNTEFTDKEDAIPQFGEATYHDNGSFLFKSSNPLKEKTYSNPSGQGTRRIALNQIRQWFGKILFCIDNESVWKPVVFC